MKKLYTYKINWERVAEGYGLSVESTIKMHNDGRIMGRLGEFIHEKVMGGLRQKEQSKFDILESNGIKSEVRTITKQLMFASSSEIGSGREVTIEGLQGKLDSIDRYVVLDIRKIDDGDITFIEITKEDLYNLPTTTRASIDAEKFYEIYDRNQQDI